MGGYRNTILYTVCGTLLNLAVTLPAAYVLAQSRFRARRFVMTLFVITMYFGGGMVPTYMLVKSLHLTNSPLIMIVMGAVSVYNVIITRTFLKIPFQMSCRKRQSWMDAPISNIFPRLSFLCQKRLFP